MDTGVDSSGARRFGLSERQRHETYEAYFLRPTKGECCCSWKKRQKKLQLNNKNHRGVWSLGRFRWETDLGAISTWRTLYTLTLTVCESSWTLTKTPQINMGQQSSNRFSKNRGWTRHMILINICVVGKDWCQQPFALHSAVILTLDYTVQGN